MILSPNRSSRGGAQVRLVAVHTAEGAKTVAALGNYFARPDVQASSHVGIDDQGCEQYVPYAEAAWTLRSGNPISDNAELCGFAVWTRQQWLDGHMPMLRQTAAWIRDRCQSRGIPLVKLSPAEVAAGRSGVIGHVDWTLGMKDGTHSDPGSNFPWDVVMSLAAPQLEDDLQPDERSALFAIRDGLAALKPGVRLPGRSPALKDTVDDHFGWSMTAAGRADTAAQDIAALRAEVAQLRDSVGRFGDPKTFAAQVAADLAARLRD